MRGPFRAVHRAVRSGLRYWWVIPVGLGFLPALLLSWSLLAQIVEADWSCSSVTFGDSAEGYGYTKESSEGVVESVTCSDIPGQLIVASAIAWLVPLFVLLALLYLVRRYHRHDQGGSPGASGGGEAMIDRVAIFVRAAAVLVGLTNMLVIDPRGDISSPDRTLVSLSGPLLLAVIAGLVASEVVLRLGRPSLSGGFLARYGITVLGMCLGGAMLGGMSIALDLLTGQPGAQAGILSLAYAFLAYGLIAALVGGIMGALEGLVLALPLAAILGVFRRPPAHRGASLPGTVTIALLMVAAIAGYEMAPPPEPTPEERAGLPPNGLPVSCPEGGGDRGIFNGVGSEATPEFEMAGDGWRYAYASAGSGAFSIEASDEDGNTVPYSSVSGKAGDEGHSPPIEAQGSFSLKVDADEEVGYTVRTCDETRPSGRNKGSSIELE